MVDSTERARFSLKRRFDLKRSQGIWFVPGGSRPVDAVCRSSPVHPPHSVTEAGRGPADRGDRPRRHCVNEQPLPVDEIGRDGTPRIDASPGSVDVNKAKGNVMDLGPEGAQSDRQFALRVSPEGLRRFNLTSTNQNINRNVHEHLLRHRRCSAPTLSRASLVLRQARRIVLARSFARLHVRSTDPIGFAQSLDCAVDRGIWMSGRGLNLERLAALDIHRYRARNGFISLLAFPATEDQTRVSNPVRIRNP